MLIFKETNLLNYFGWLSSFIGSITLFSSLVGMLQLSSAARYVVDHWNSIILFFWKNILFFLPDISSLDANFLTIFIAFTSVLIWSGVGTTKAKPNFFRFAFFSLLFVSIFSFSIATSFEHDHGPSLPSLKEKRDMPLVDDIIEKPNEDAKFQERLKKAQENRGYIYNVYIKVYQGYYGDNWWLATRVYSYGLGVNNLIFILITILLLLLFWISGLGLSSIILATIRSQINFRKSSNKLFVVICFTLGIVILNYVAVTAEHFAAHIEKNNKVRAQ